MLGTTWTQVSTLMGKEIVTKAKVTSYEEDRVLGAEVDKPFPGQMVWRMEANGHGTVVTVGVDLEPGGFFGIAAPLLAKNIREQFSSDLTDLKAKLEAPG